MEGTQKYKKEVHQFGRLNCANGLKNGSEKESEMTQSKFKSVHRALKDLRGEGLEQQTN